MKLYEYIDKLNTLIKNNPDCLNYDVVYAVDNEGNNFQKVIYDPTIGVFENNEYIVDDSDDNNAVCIN